MLRWMMPYLLGSSERSPRIVYVYNSHDLGVVQKNEEETETETEKENESHLHRMIARYSRLTSGHIKGLELR
jgi:hypothetical protein